MAARSLVLHQIFWLKKQKILIFWRLNWNVKSGAISTKYGQVMAIFQIFIILRFFNMSLISLKMPLFFRPLLIFGNIVLTFISIHFVCCQQARPPPPVPPLRAPPRRAPRPRCPRGSGRRSSRPCPPAPPPPGPRRRGRRWRSRRWPPRARGRCGRGA